LEGVIFSLRDVSELIREMGVPLRQIRTSGGGALSQIWRQIHADVFGSEVLTMSGGGEGGAYGAALVAGAGAGVWPSVHEAVEVLKVETRNIPIQKNVELYDRLFKIYQSFYGILKGSFQGLSQFA
jgi:xylulokinase